MNVCPRSMRRFIQQIHAICMYSPPAIDLKSKYFSFFCSSICCCCHILRQSASSVILSPFVTSSLALACVLHPTVYTICLRRIRGTMHGKSRQYSEYRNKINRKSPIYWLTETNSPTGDTFQFFTSDDSPTTTHKILPNIAGDSS